MEIKVVSIDDVLYPTAYRVVTASMQSLGLRHNPHILTYPVDEWYILPPDWVEAGRTGWGGIWVKRTLTRANGLRKYMADKHNTDTRIFFAAIRDILYSTPESFKTSGIYLIEEIL